jgi:hypothetical protein
VVNCVIGQYSHINTATSSHTVPQSTVSSGAASRSIGLRIPRNAALKTAETPSEAKQLTTFHLVLYSSLHVNFFDYYYEIRFHASNHDHYFDPYASFYNNTFTTYAHITSQFMAIHKL